MALALRIIAYLTFLLGAGMLLGLVPSVPVGHIHMTLAFLLVILALVAVPTGPGPRRPVRVAARFFPLITLVLGLVLFQGYQTQALRWTHGVFGLVTVGLLDVALSRRSRAA